jgi:hypothetical protein
LLDFNWSAITVENRDDTAQWVDLPA